MAERNASGAIAIRVRIVNEAGVEALLRARHLAQRLGVVMPWCPTLKEIERELTQAGAELVVEREAED